MRYSLTDTQMVTARAFDDEVIVANFSTGVYFSLQDSAAEIWLGLMAGAPVDDVAQSVGQHSRMTPEEFAKATWTFVRALEGEQLIAPASASGEVGWQPKTPAEFYNAPRFDRYDDMEDLLLLEPCHDVGKVGWPAVLRKKK